MEFVPLTEDLAHAVAPWFDDPDSIRYLGTRDWSYRALQLMQTAPGAEFRGRHVLARYVWIVLDNAGQPCGLIDAEPYDDGTAGIALLVAPEKRGQGLGRSILHLLELQPELQGLQTIVAGVEPENISARRCLERAGYAIAYTPDEEGFLRFHKQLSCHGFRDGNFPVTPSYRDLPGIHASPNIQTAPDLYELENRAADPEGLLEHAIQEIADWTGKIVLDLGAGTGFHIPRFHQAEHIFAVEPHDPSRLLAMHRIAHLALHNVSILKGSAEFVPLRDQSVDICHSRFAYFFAPDCLPGLHELERVMRPGGTVFIIDNDLVEGTFAEWLLQTPFYKSATASEVSRFWREQGFTEQSIASEWRFERREDLEKVVRLEFGDALAEKLLTQHEGLQLSYHYKLYYRAY